MKNWILGPGLVRLNVFHYTERYSNVFERIISDTAEYVRTDHDSTSWELVWNGATQPSILYVWKIQETDEIQKQYQSVVSSWIRKSLHFSPPSSLFLWVSVSRPLLTCHSFVSPLASLRAQRCPQNVLSISTWRTFSSTLESFFEMGGRLLHCE